MKKTALLQMIAWVLVVAVWPLSQAHAVSVTNLDTVTHNLQVEATGEILQKPIMPRQTIRLSPFRQTLTLLLQQGNKSN